MTEQSYEDRVGAAIDILSDALEELGYHHHVGAGHEEIVEVATRKLKTLFHLCRAAGLSDHLMTAIMAE